MRMSLPLLILVVLLSACAITGTPPGSDQPTVATLTAEFGPDAPAGQRVAEFGTVTWEPGQVEYTYGTPVHLSASAAEGWTFSHWTVGNPGTITAEEFDAIVEDMRFSVATTGGKSQVLFPDLRLPIPDGLDIDDPDIHAVITPAAIERGFIWIDSADHKDLVLGALADLGFSGLEPEEVTVHPDILEAAAEVEDMTRSEAEETLRNTFESRSATASFSQD